MTREEFIEVLQRRSISYTIEEDKIVVTWGQNEGGKTRRVNLGHLRGLPPKVEFRNKGGLVDLDSIKTIPPGIEFNNGKPVNLDSLVGGWFDEWKGNIEGIDSNRLLNVMIKKGLFER